MRILLDSNALLLLVVGYIDRDLIKQFSRTRSIFTVDDFDYLVSRIPGRATLLTTPHILAEVSNLAGNDESYYAALVRAQMRITITLLAEHHVPAPEAADHGLYEKLGLTDAAIATLITGTPATVITTDMRLWNALLAAGVNVENLAIRPK